MSFLNKILSNKKDASRDRRSRKQAEAKPTEKREAKAEAAAEIKLAGPVSRVILAPHITEKTAALGAANKFVFLVEKTTNKIEVKRAVESQYGVRVTDVHIVNTRGKERRRGWQIGWKPGHKKAIVKIKEGQTIELG